MYAPFLKLGIAALVASVLSPALSGLSRADEVDGIMKVKSAYAMEETITRIKEDVADKGIMFFSEIDQAQLAEKAGIKLRPSTLLVFGNPPLGTLFVTVNANAGLDRPVRLLVNQDDQGQVWLTYTAFDWIARRHQITSRKDEFAKAATVIASIASSVTKR